MIKIVMIEDDVKEMEIYYYERSAKMLQENQIYNILFIIINTGATAITVS